MKPVQYYPSYIHHDLMCVYSGRKPPNLHKWGPGVRDIYAIHYISKGKGTLETKNGVFPLLAGESFVIFPEAEVNYYPDPQDPWAYVWVEFKGEEAQSLLSKTEFKKDKPVVAASPMNLEPLFPSIENVDVKPFERMRSEAQLRLLLSYYMEYYPSETTIPSMDYVRLAQEYIEHNYWRTTLTVSDIVNAVKVERSYLFRLFKAAAGMSISAYLTDYRIRRACELLKSSGLSIKSVACSVGYSDQLYFSKRFKKATSYTPSEYMTLHSGQAER
ncbi:AraC family transcriptional regulator [Paenibacillus lemnae]|uniref:AraC family transcriptional regulator n=1 Tax=Paenibacillus lemnae TaxID=1330551 RepID=A0A848MDE6_PAELE|nr:AraC family transcriptional regulator [Paenibacillus lemnae]NMO98170.1 AraC family transcriptional regulator [Paenibacillus lemnae]